MNLIFRAHFKCLEAVDPIVLSVILKLYVLWKSDEIP